MDKLLRTVGQSLRAEAFKINLINAPAGARIKYEGHVQDLAWLPVAYDGQIAGTEGLGLRLEAIKISLENMPGYSVQYQAHVQNIGWQPWVSDGQVAGTEGLRLPVEALRIRIVSVPLLTVHPISVSSNKSTVNLTTGDSETLVAAIVPANATNQTVVWTSSNNLIATVDNAGKVTAIASGSATIAATTIDGSKVANCIVTVVNRVAVTGVILEKTTDNLLVGGTDNLIAGVAPVNAMDKTVTWSSSNGAIATVDSTGKVTAVSAGSATVTVTTNDGYFTANCTVSVASNDCYSISRC